MWWSKKQTEGLRHAGANLDIRMLQATGGGQAAELAQQAEAARREVKSMTDGLNALGASADDAAATLLKLEQVQGAERVEIDMPDQAWIKAHPVEPAGPDILCVGDPGKPQQIGRLSDPADTLGKLGV